MGPLHGFAFHRLISVPQPPDTDLQPGRPDPVSAQLFAALTASYTGLKDAGPGAALAVGRVRPQGDPHIAFLVGGRPWFPPAGGDGDPMASTEVDVYYPPGARAAPVATEVVRADLEALPHWVVCTGQPDAIWLDQDEGARNLRGSFDDYIAHLRGGFGWLVVAEPLSPTAVNEQLAELSVRIPGLRKRESSEQHRVELQQAESRYRELRRARVTGLWNVRVLVGAMSASSARSAAALLCSAAELNSVPYILTPGAATVTFEEALVMPAQVGDACAPFVGSSELVLALARPPARELPGIRTVAPLCFDVTPEFADLDGIPVGDVLDEARRPVGPLRVSRASLNRHAFVCGATGSGKSQTVRTMLENLARAASPVPWLVIEPAKSEYARMAGRLSGASEITVIRPGDPDTAPASLNPLEPEPGFPLQSHADLVRALFLAAFEANEPFPQVLSRALTQVYTAAGWDLVTGEPRPATKPILYAHETAAPVAGRYPTLAQLQRTASAIVGQIGYGKEITADVRGFVDVRIGSLREGTPGRFFEGGHPLDVGKLLSRNVVLELEDITNDQDKAFLIGAVLIRIVEHLRVRAARGDTRPGLRHLTVVEEAHRLLKNVRDGPAAAAVELFASLLAEIRAYGEGVVVVEQIPSKILPDVVKNSALKIMHRLPALDDREAVGATINLTPEQSELVVSFVPGTAAVAVDGMDAPLLIRVPDRESAESERGAVRVPPLRAARSPLCAADCAATPCVLREINDNQHCSRQTALLVWTETATVSFLIGEPPPLPSPAVKQLLAPLTSHARRCTLVHGVERSAEVRRSELIGWFDVDDFAAHVLRALERLLDGDRADDGDWRRWTAGLYRWLEMRHALSRSVAEGHADAAPHPDTAQWADLGMVLDAPNRAGQYAQLRAHPTYGEDRQRFLLGDARRSGLLDAVLELAGTVTDAGISRALDHGCRGQRTDLIVPRIAGPLRAAEAGAY